MDFLTFQNSKTDTSTMGIITTNLLTKKSKSMEYKKLTQAQVDALQHPLPAEALKPHPSKSFLTTINAIYVTERLNEVFGVGAWQIHPVVEERKDKMVVVRTTLTIPEYGIEYECFGGNDNADLGYAYKGATTDAITKIGSWLGIGADVWKNKAGKKGNTTHHNEGKGVTPQEAQLKALSLEQVKQKEQEFKYFVKGYCKTAADVKPLVQGYYTCDDATIDYLIKLFNE